MSREKEVLAQAKTITAVDNWEQWEEATKVVNALAEFDTKETNRQFERITNLMVNCPMAA